MRVPLFLLPLLGAACAHSLEEAVFHQTAVVLAQGSPAQPKQFMASGKRIAILFRSDSSAAAHEIDVFPEPPVIIRDKTGGASCQIMEGGIWVRSAVYLSADERHVVLNEYSGSASDLVSYDTRTCREVKRLDVSGMRWTVEKTRLRLGKQCTGSGMTNCAAFQFFDLHAFTHNSSLPGQP